MDPQAEEQYHPGQPLDPTVGPLLAPQDPAAPQPVRPGVASVLNYGKGVVRVRWPDGTLTGGGKPFRRPVMIQDVDLGRHYSTFTADVPAAGGGVLRFSAEIDIEWQVTHPLQVVHTNTTNVVAALRHRLLNEISPISSRYAVDMPVEAEAAIRDWCRSDASSRLGEDCGLETHFFVRLKTNAQAEANYQRIQETVGNSQVETLTSADMLRKVDMYRGLIAGGELDQAAAQIAQDPTNMSNIIGALWEQGAARREETIGFIRTLINSGTVQPHQINGQARAALAWLENSTASVIGPPPQHVEPVAPPQLVGERSRRRPELEGGRDRYSDEADRPVMRERWRHRSEPPARAEYEDDVRQPRRRAAEPTYDEQVYDEPVYAEPERSSRSRQSYQDSDFQDARHRGSDYRDSAESQDSRRQDSRYQDSTYEEPERPTVREEPERPRRRADRDWQSSGYFDDVD